MHKYVVMAHAEDPGNLAGLIVGQVTGHFEAEPVQILDIDSPNKNSGPLFDTVVIFELVGEIETNIDLFNEVDRNVRNLAPENGWRVETMRDTTPH